MVKYSTLLYGHPLKAPEYRDLRLRPRTNSPEPNTQLIKMHSCSTSLLDVSIVIAFLAVAATAYRSGAPNCAVRVPGHNGYAPQTSPNPYEMHASKTSEGDFLVSIGSPDAEESFAGFRIVSEFNAGEGTFLPGHV